MRSFFLEWEADRADSDASEVLPKNHTSFSACACPFALLLHPQSDASGGNVSSLQVKELDPNCLKLVSDLSTMTPVDETATISSSDLPNPAVLYVLHRPRDLTPLQF